VKKVKRTPLPRDVEAAIRGRGMCEARLGGGFVVEQSPRIHNLPAFIFGPTQPAKADPRLFYSSCEGSGQHQIG